VARGASLPFCVIGRKPLRFGLCACFPRSRRRLRRRCLGSGCSGPELQSALTIEKRFARGAKLNGATGEERDGRKSREAAVSESGDERINSLRNAAIRCARLKKAPTGWNCSWNRELSARKSSHLCGKNGARKQSDIDASPKGERFGSESMRRADCDFRYHPEAREDFLILPSAFRSRVSSPT